MGSLIEINDTLKISKERGFPKELSLENHQKNPKLSLSMLDKEFSFWNIDERLYNRPQSRVFLVEETKEGKWIYWGHALIIEQTIKKSKNRRKVQDY